MLKMFACVFWEEMFYLLTSTLKKSLVTLILVSLDPHKDVCDSWGLTLTLTHLKYRGHGFMRTFT